MNAMSSDQIRVSGNDNAKRRAQFRRMGKRSTPAPTVLHDWYFAEWAAMFGKRQADACADLGWSKAKASMVWTGQQRYNRELVDEVSRWLSLRPWELLMSPAEAMQLRRLRDAAATIVQIDQPIPQRNAS